MVLWIAWKYLERDCGNVWCDDEVEDVGMCFFGASRVSLVHRSLAAVDYFCILDHCPFDVESCRVDSLTFVFPDLRCVCFGRCFF